MAGVFALTGKQYSARLALDTQMLDTLRKKHGDLENDFRAATGYCYAALTQSEARTLANYHPAEQVRVRILDARDAGSSTTDPGAT